MKKKIIIVDDHEVVRLGLKSLLDKYPQYEVVSEAKNAREAVDQVEKYRPDIVLMDIVIVVGGVQKWIIAKNFRN